MHPDVVGFVGGGLVALALLPQVVKAWHTKSTRDISLLWTSLLLAGLFVSALYGVLIDSLPLIVFNCVEMAFTLSLVVLKLMYK